MSVRPGPGYSDPGLGNPVMVNPETDLRNGFEKLCLII